MSKKKLNYKKNLSCDEMIESVLDAHKSVRFETFDDGVMEEYIMYVDDKEVLRELSIKLCLEAFLDT
jgi:hypothetical protein